ncbi:MAG TPA: 8-oxo-dGTP diphosphatase [Candidatus Saccharimonadales bacterium]|nr:8-oxo-dGTP diphosphatase [Candidatus Saccharimonadales bacterium]
MKHVTLVFLRRSDEILLAMKKRGFGAGKWNGAGGKMEDGETPLQAAVRESQEEIGVTPRNLQKVGEIDFYLKEEPDFNHYAHIYISTEWDGEPHETEEMRPQWFPLAEIPYDQMWGDDKYWLPDALASKRFKATYKLDKDDNIVESNVTYLNEGEEF